MDQEEKTGVTICKPLAALEIGFHTRMLRTLQESVWAVKFEDMHNVDAGLESIHRRLITLSDRLNQLQFSLFSELKTRIEDRHDTAAALKGQLRAELLREVSDPQEAMRLLPRRIEERAVVPRGWQKEDWDEVRLLTWKAVEGDHRLEAWWEIGIRMADMMLRVGTPEAPATWTEADVKGLLGAVAKLPSEEKAWVEDILPSTPPTEPRFPFLVNEAYKDLRGFILEFEKRRAPTGQPGTGAAAEFVPSDHYRVCRWHGREYTFNESQAAMIAALHLDTQQGGAGLSAAKLFQAAGLDRDDKRLEHVFRNKKEGRWVPHPAWVDGLIQHVHGGTYRLNIQEPKEPRS